MIVSDSVESGSVEPKGVFQEKVAVWSQKVLSRESGSVEPKSAFQENVGGGSVKPDSAFQEKVGFLP